MDYEFECEDMPWDQSVFSCMLTTKVTFYKHFHIITYYFYHSCFYFQFKSQTNAYTKLNKMYEYLTLIRSQYDVLSIIKDKYCPIVFMEYIDTIMLYCSENFDKKSLCFWIKIIEVSNILRVLFIENTHLCPSFYNIFSGV